MTQPQIELSPCPNPSCNSADVSESSVLSGGRLWLQIRCAKCRTTGPTSLAAEECVRLWQSMPRSSPQVAPGLRERIYDALFNDHICGNDPDSKIQRAADIAAAQGGTVVDRADFDGWLAQVIADYEKESRWLEFYAAQYIQEGYRKRQSAVPSAPGCERVKAAFVALDNDLEARAVMINDFYPRWMELKAAVEALGAPQGSDSLRWTADIPTEAGYYWGVDGLRRLSLINVSHWYEDDDTLYYKAYMWGGEDGPLEEIGQPRLQPRMFAKYKMPSIPEPAQPVDAGEAKERGDNE